MGGKTLQAGRNRTRCPAPPWVGAKSWGWGRVGTGDRTDGSPQAGTSPTNHNHKSRTFLRRPMDCGPPTDGAANPPWCTRLASFALAILVSTSLATANEPLVPAGPWGPWGDQALAATETSSFACPKQPFCAGAVGAAGGFSGLEWTKGTPRWNVVGPQCSHPFRPTFNLESAPEEQGHYG